MKRTSLAIFAILLMFTLVASAAENPVLGKWKLNVEKSKYVPGPAPKNLTRTAEADGDKFKFTYEGVAADGSAISYTFSVAYDGKDYPITGSGATGGADSVAVRQLGPRSFAATLKKAGTPVAKSRVTISADGKVTTFHVNSPDRKSFHNTLVYEKE